jgi:hypothetical protein
MYYGVVVGYWLDWISFGLNLDLIGEVCRKFDYELLSAMIPSFF